MEWEPRPTFLWTQLLSSDPFPVPVVVVVVVECCLTSTETSRINVRLNQTVGLLGTGARTSTSTF